MIFILNETYVFVQIKRVTSSRQSIIYGNEKVRQ